MLILAGVAFRDAGVLVRLLLLGVMPLDAKKGLKTIHCIPLSVSWSMLSSRLGAYSTYLAQALGNGP